MGSCRRAARRSAWIASAIVVAACSGGGGGGGGGGSDRDPLVNQARTGSVTPFGPRDQPAAEVEFAPGADAEISVYTSRLTLYDGTVATSGLLSLELIPSTITQTPSLSVVSPLMLFRAVGADGAVLPRPDLRKQIKAEVIVDRFVDAENTVVLMILNYGTTSEERYMIVPDDLSFQVQEDNSRLITFETRDTDFAFAVAVAEKGVPTNGFSQYVVVPPDSAAFVGTSEDVADQPTEVALSWTPAEGTHAGYRLQVAYEEIATTGCEDGDEIPAADITEVRESFPKVYVDSYVARALTEDQPAVYFQLCSVNSRVPPDVSPGVNETFSLPTRALATLSGAPADPSNATALDVTVASVVDYQYAILSDADDCAGATYSDWIAVATKITDTVTEGERLLCVLGRKTETNVQITPTTYAWTVDLTPPGAFTVAAATTPTNDTTPTLTWAASTDAVGYTVKVATDAACTTVTQTLSPTAATATASVLAEGTYYVCVTAADAAGNTTAATNDGAVSFVVDTTPPTFTSLVAANEASDGYLNANEVGAANALLTLTASGHTVDDFTAALDDTPAVTCDASQTYGSASIPLINTVTAADDSYAVCARLTDAAGNVTYGKSAVVVRDVVAPSFTSLALANDAADGYLNATEIASGSAVAMLTASGYAVDDYSAALDDNPSVTCDGSQTYGDADVPAISATPGADESYAVCVRLTDAAGNVTYGKSGTVVRDATPPTFTSLALANGASDGYVNAAEIASGLDLAALTASGHTVDDFSAPLDNTPAVTCNGGQTYGGTDVPAISAIPAADDTYVVCVRLADAAGNLTYGSSAAVVRDTQAPAATDVASTTAAGYYGATSTINVTVTLGEAATLGGSAGDAQLLLETGTTDRNAVYTGGTGTTTLTFEYTVQAGDTSADLDLGAAPQLTFTGDRSLRDLAGNDMTVNLGGATSLAANENLVVDTTAPSAFNITAPTAAATINDNTYSIAWADPGDAAEYDVKIDDTSGCASPLQTFTDVAGLSQAATLADGAQFVCVVARDQAGNETAATNTNLTFTVATGNWSATTGTGAPAARRAATAVWDDTNSRVIVWGGFDGVNQLASGGHYDATGNSWTATDEADADLPVERDGHTAVWDGTGVRMIVWGGYNTSDGYLDAGGLYDPDGPDAWVATTTTSAPSARRGHVAVWTGTTMIVWGGEDGGGVLADGGVYTPPGSEGWAATQSTGAPAGRRGATAVWTGTEMIVWGGHDGTVTLASGGRLDPSGAGTWTAVTATGAPAAREGHTAVWTGTDMIVWGGHDGTNYLQTGGVYDPVGDTWTATTTTDVLSVRRDHVAVWDAGNALMIVFSGYGGSYLGNGAAYDPALDQWVIPSLNSAGAPAARRDAAAVWAGDRLVVLGGYDGGVLATGGQFTAP